MTIEEEMIQARPRRRMDGFSADGLSYSVASDFDKLLGQAMAEYEARTKSPAQAQNMTQMIEGPTAGPRFVPGARVENPDAPDLLRQELLDPVFMAANAFQGRSVRPTAAKEFDDRLLKSGQDYLQRDPATGELKVAYKAPRIDNKARDFKLEQISKQIQGLASLKYDPAKAAMAGLDATKIDAEIKKLNSDAEKLLGGDTIEEALTATPAPAPTPAPTPQIFMGEKTGGINIGAAPEYSAAAARKAAAPRPGDVDNGYRFKGGNPKDKSNWERVR